MQLCKDICRHVGHHEQVTCATDARPLQSGRAIVHKETSRDLNAPNTIAHCPTHAVRCVALCTTKNHHQAMHAGLVRTLSTWIITSARQLLSQGACHAQLTPITSTSNKTMRISSPKPLYESIGQRHQHDCPQRSCRLPTLRTRSYPAQFR